MANCPSFIRGAALFTCSNTFDGPSGVQRFSLIHKESLCRMAGSALEQLMYLSAYWRLLLIPRTCLFDLDWVVLGQVDTLQPSLVDPLSLCTLQEEPWGWQPTAKAGLLHSAWQLH
jgi:hypothetical protein